MSTTYTANVYRDLWGSIGFSKISIEKGSKNHKETPYSSKGNIVYVVGNPVMFTDSRKILLLS